MEVYLAIKKRLAKDTPNKKDFKSIKSNKEGRLKRLYILH